MNLSPIFCAAVNSTIFNDHIKKIAHIGLPHRIENIFMCHNANFLHSKTEQFADEYLKRSESFPNQFKMKKSDKKVIHKPLMQRID